MIIKGISVSPGVAIGEAYVYRAFVADVTKAYFAPEETQMHLRCFQHALKQANEELDNVIASFAHGRAKDLGDIFIAHQAILNDEEMLSMVRVDISNAHKMPDFAVAEVFAGFITELEKCADPLLASRTADVRDVRNRLLRLLRGKKEKNLSGLQKPVIVVAHNLLPSDAATMNRKYVLGIITQAGCRTSHSAILANTFEIPSITGVRNCTQIISDGDLIGLDATTGEIYVLPTQEQKDSLEQKKSHYDANR